MYVNEVDGFKVGDRVVLNYSEGQFNNYIGDIAHIQYNEEQRKFYVDIEFGFGFLNFPMKPGFLKPLPYNSDEIKRYPNDKKRIATTPLNLVYEWVQSGKWSLGDFKLWQSYVIDVPN